MTKTPTMQDLMKRWKSRCAYCGCRVERRPNRRNRSRAVKDTFIPNFSAEPLIHNSILACSMCKSFKAATDPRVLLSIWIRLDPESARRFFDALAPALIPLEAGTTPAPLSALPPLLLPPLLLPPPTKNSSDAATTLLSEEHEPISSPSAKPIANGSLLLGWHKATQSTGLLKASALDSPIIDGPEGHLITIAPTGAGKGVSCIIPALLSWEGPAVVIDPKGENYAVTARRRRELGQRVEVLDPFNVTGIHKRARLNPLDLIDIRTPNAEDDAAVIAHLLSDGMRFAQDPFWDERAETVNRHLILEHLREDPNAANKSLGHVRRAVEKLDAPPDYTSSAAFLEATQGKKRKHIPGLGVERTRAAILATAMSHLTILRDGPVLNSLCDSTIALDDIRDGAPLTIYLVLPPDKLNSHGKLLRLWLGVIMATLARRRRIPPKPTLLLIDEAAQLGQLDELRSALTLMRGYGVKVWSFWQDFSQLQRLYPDWPSILNNCAVQQFFGAYSPFAAEALESLLVGRAPCRISDLQHGEAIVVQRSASPTRFRLPDYRRDLIFIGLADTNPFYPHPPTVTEPVADTPAIGNVLTFPTNRRVQK